MLICDLEQTITHDCSVCVCPSSSIWDHSVMILMKFYTPEQQVF
jgi:hypothetical protein